MDEGLFRKKLTEFCEYTKEKFPKFHEYFKNNYISEDKIKFWAACFRKGCISNTNMYAEAFHRTLKGIYFGKRQNKRMDALLTVLLKISKDTACEQLIKNAKGRMSYRLREIQKRHKCERNPGQCK